MHSTGAVIVSLAATAASVTGHLPDRPWTLAALVVGVALVGVPHGGLDHWVGRDLLAPRLRAAWPLVFFPAYAAVGLVTAAGWWVAPLATVLVFFLLSAWHFGVEDGLAETGSPLRKHLAATAVGGLVIWIPALFQRDMFRDVLQSIIPAATDISAADCLSVTQWVAAALVPVALAVTANDLCQPSRRIRGVRQLSFAILFALADPLVSFGVYFCGWHSLQGLARLARQHQRSRREIAVAVLPLSIATLLLAAGGWWLNSSAAPVNEAVTRVLFIGLSAIAVPHLLLHGPLTESLRERLTPSRNAASTFAGAKL